MPETKFKNLSQADELVPMDTDGEEVEIELEEGSTTTIKSDVVEEMIEENNNEEIKDETEHEEYSKGVSELIS